MTCPHVCPHRSSIVTSRLELPPLTMKFDHFASTLSRLMSSSLFVALRLAPSQRTALPWAQGVGRSNRPAPTNRIKQISPNPSGEKRLYGSTPTMGADRSRTDLRTHYLKRGHRLRPAEGIAVSYPLEREFQRADSSLRKGAILSSTIIRSEAFWLGLKSVQIPIECRVADIHPTILLLPRNTARRDRFPS
jgi:hypothetical protein